MEVAPTACRISAPQPGVEPRTHGSEKGQAPTTGPLGNSIIHLLVMEVQWCRYRSLKRLFSLLDYLGT